MGWFLMGAGLVNLCGAIFDWDWFMDHPRTRFINSIIGRTGARIFQVVMSFIIIGCGFLMVFGPGMGIVKG